jgi:hypothetical protein
MALRLLNPAEVGERVATVRVMAGYDSQRKLRIALGSSDSNLVNDIEEGKKKIVDYHRLGHIAELCEDRGQLKGMDAQAILDYLIGRVDWDLRPRLVKRADEASPVQGLQSTYTPQPAPDLRVPALPLAS